MSRPVIRAMGLALTLCLSLCVMAGTASAAPSSGKITGLVVDSAGAPQMGATVIVTSDQLLNNLSLQLLTNDRGRFSTATLPAGLYSIKVTLAGFLPAIEQDIQVSDQHTTLLEIVLGSVFTSFEKLRRTPDQQVSSDEWGWVLRASAATRPVLRWQDGDVTAAAGLTRMDNPQLEAARARVELTSGSDHPGSISNVADSPGTAFAYAYGLGELGSFLMAGQFSYAGNSEAGGFVTQWVPSGDSGSGPVTTLLMRMSQLGPSGPTFRGLRMSHDSSFKVVDSVSVRYGADFIAAGFDGTTTSLRPRAEMAVRISPTMASFRACDNEHVAGIGRTLRAPCNRRSISSMPFLRCCCAVVVLSSRTICMRNLLSNMIFRRIQASPHLYFMTAPITRPSLDTAPCPDPTICRTTFPTFLLTTPAN